MTYEMKEIITYCALSEFDVPVSLDKYFGEIMWSITKEQYNRMSENERISLINFIDNKIKSGQV